MISLMKIFKILCYTITIGLIFPVFLNIITKIYLRFRDSSVSFTLDTSFLNWNTTFPAITVCEIPNGEKLWDLCDQHFGEGRDHRLDDFISDVVYFSGKCNLCSSCNTIGCPKNFTKLTEIFRARCEKLIEDCFWIEEPFKCCDEFKPLATEFGLCYSFNSMQIKNFKNLKFINNRETGPGLIDFTVTEDVQVHVHPPYDVPYLLSEGVIRETVSWGSTKEIILNIIEMVNDPSVRNFEPNRRKCRFATEFENENRLYQFYSFSTCVLECVKEAHLKTCGCVSHFMTSDIQNETSGNIICGIEGLICITENYENFAEIRQNCDCLSSCEEPEYNVIYISEENENTNSHSRISVSLVSLPTQRYIRNAVKTSLDLLISVGGIAGLFFGASLLSFLEAIYWIVHAVRKKYVDYNKNSMKSTSKLRKRKKISKI